MKKVYQSCLNLILSTSFIISCSTAIAQNGSIIFKKHTNPDNYVKLVDFEQLQKEFALEKGLSSEEYLWFTRYISERYNSKDRGSLFKGVEEGSIQENNIDTFKKALKDSYNRRYQTFLIAKDSFIQEYEKSHKTINPRLEAANGPCTNIGFEDGTFNGWSGSVLERNSNKLQTGFKHHCVMKPGMKDPLIPNLSVIPPGKTHSVRLGNVAHGGHLASISQTFKVDASNVVFTYSYAVVLEDPAEDRNDKEHQGLMRPHFQAKLKTQGGQEINCAQYSVVVDPTLVGYKRVCGKYNKFSDSDFNQGCPAGAQGYDGTYPEDPINNPEDTISVTTITYPATATESCSNKDIYYKDWSTVSVILDKYIGQNVTIEFTSADCHPGGHFGYAYVHAQCSGLNVSAPEVICPGQTKTIEASPGFKTYKWATTDGAIVSGANTRTITINKPGKYSVTVEPFSDNPCPYTVDYVVKQLCDPVDISETFCSTDKGTPKKALDLTTFDARITNGFTSATILSWHTAKPATAANKISNPKTVEATDNSKYFALMKYGTTEYTVGLTIRVNPKPDATFPNFPPFCLNANQKHIITPTSPGGTFSGPHVTPNGEFTPKAEGTFDIKHLIVNSFGCRDSVIRQAKVLSNPTVAVEGDSIFCYTGAPVTLPITAAVSPGTNVTWSTDYGTIDNPNAISTNLKLSGLTIDQTFKVSVVAKLNGCPDAKGLVTFKSKQIPTVTVGNDTSLCSFGGLLTLFAKGVVSNQDSVRWDSPNITFTNKFNPSSNASFNYTNFPQVNTFDVQLTAKKEKCPNVTKSFKVTINPGPKVELPEDISKCSPNSSASINLISNHNNPDSIVWQTNGGALKSRIGTTNFLTLSQEGTVKVEALAYKNGCAPVKDEMNIVFEIIPTVNASVTYTCDPDLKILLVGTVTKAGTPTTGEWSKNGTGTFGAAASNLTNNYIPSPAEISSGSATINLASTGGSGICAIQDTSITLTIVPLPVADPGATVNLCVGESFTRTAVTGPSWTYTWKTKAGTPLSTSETVTYKPTTELTELVLTVKNSRNCEASKGLLVNALPSPEFSLLGDTVCPGEPGIIKAILNDPSKAALVTGTWKYNGQVVSNDWSSYTYTNTGNYNLELTYKGICPVSNPIVISPLPVPIIDIPDKYPYCYEQAPFITIASNTFPKYEWYQENNFLGNNSSISVSPKVDTKYLLKVENEVGCRDSMELLVRKVCPPRLFVPNVITPGTENINAGLHIFGAHYANFEISVFNRWGEVIFRTKDPKAAWDGIYNNENIPIGNYPWLVTYEGDCEEFKGPYKLVGDVTVVR